MKLLDVVNHLRNHQFFKILLKMSLMDKQVKYQLAHSEKNLIDLDESDSDQSLSSCSSSCFESESLSDESWHK